MRYWLTVQHFSLGWGRLVPSFSKKENKMTFGRRLIMFAITSYLFEFLPPVLKFGSVSHTEGFLFFFFFRLLFPIIVFWSSKELRSFSSGLFNFFFYYYFYFRCVTHQTNANKWASINISWWRPSQPIALKPFWKARALQTAIKNSSSPPVLSF